MIELERIVIRENASLQEALERMELNGFGMLFVADESGRLLGAFSDGDARRAILSQVPVSERIPKVMNPNPRTILNTTPTSDARTLMNEHRIRFVPVVDSAGRIVGIVADDDVLHARTLANRAVIMCGGMGKRLQHLTLSCPKPLLKVGGRPILETIISQLRSCGITQIMLAINYLGHMIEDCFGDGHHLDVQIEYLRERKRLGTAGALRLIEDRPTQPLLVVNGDVLTRLNVAELLRFHESHEAQLTMSIVEYTMTLPYGVVECDEREMLREIREKPSLAFFVNAGIYAIDPAMLDHIPPDAFFDMTDFVSVLQQHQKKIATFPIHEYWMDIGQLEDFSKANGHFDEIFRESSHKSRKRLHAA